MCATIFHHAKYVLVFLVARVKMELETSAAWSSCPSASLPQNRQAEVCVLLSITSCCCISSWLQRKSISCFFGADSSSALWSSCAAPCLRPCPQKLFQLSQGVFYLKIKVCCAQRIMGESVFLKPCCPFQLSLLAGESRVTWGVLMLLGGFVGDAKLIMAMLGFTGDQWHLLSHFMDPE